MWTTIRTDIYRYDKEICLLNNKWTKLPKKKLPFCFLTLGSFPFSIDIPALTLMAWNVKTLPESLQVRWRRGCTNTVKTPTLPKPRRSCSLLSRRWLWPRCPRGLPTPEGDWRRKTRWRRLTLTLMTLILKVGWQFKIIYIYIASPVLIFIIT